MVREIPPGWGSGRIGDLFEMQLGKMLSKHASAGPHQAAYLANRHVQWDRVTLEGLDTMSFTPDEREKYAIRPGDLLVCEGGEVGRTALWHGEREDVFFQKAIHRLRPHNGEVVPAFMLRFMRFAAQRGYFTDLASQTSIAHLTQEKLARLEIPLAPLPEQQRIAEILDTLDEAIRKTEQLIAKLKQVKQGLLHDLLTRGIDDNGELRDPARHPEQFKDSTMGRIPNTWTIETLGSLSLVVRGSTPRPAKDPRYFDGDFIPWITVGELSRDEWPFLTTTSTKLTELGSRFSRRLEPGTLVLSNSGFGCGVPKLLELSGCANDGIAAFLELAPRSIPLFLYYYLFSQIGTLRTRVARGVDQPNLNTDLLRAFPAPVPGVAEQEEIASRIFAVASRGRAEETYLQKLRLLKQGLMEDLLTGRVRVANLLGNETAP